MTQQHPAVSDPDPESAGPAGRTPPAAPSGVAATASERGSPRWWSERRVPAAATAFIVLVATAFLLFDVIRVRTGHTAAAWRRTLADELASRPIDDPWVITGAAVAAVLGLWLLVLALAPGRRHLLPMAVTDDPDGPQAALDRDGAARLLRDAALRVPGVSHADVRVRRRRINARAQVAFRDPDTVRTDLTTALTAQRDALGLARSPRLTVRVRQDRA